MKKRMMCFLLSVLMVVSLIPAMALGASAASSLTTSEEGIALIKKFEGFIKYPMSDYSQYSIGYGTQCPSDKLDYYKANGITEAEADELLREHLAKDEKRLNTFADKFGLVLTQYQFDALMSFTYNLGPDWMNNESTFRSAVTSSATGNDFLFAITQWCNAADEVKEHLVKRRLAEANVYLNGEYSITPPEKYSYVLFDSNDGTCTIKIQGYNTNVTDTIRAVPTHSGYRFVGWYTAKAGGQWITELDAGTAESTLYARWQKDEGPVDQDGNILGTAANYERYTSDLTALAVRDVPKISGETIQTLEKGQTVTIVADYVDANNVKWGKLSTGGWINLSQTGSGIVGEEEPEPVIVTVTVTSAYVNIRSGAGAGYTFIRQAQKGETMDITQVKMVDDVKWGKFSGGWVCLSYTNYETVIVESNPDASVVTATGVVSVDGLRIRTGTSTSTDIVGTLNKGDKVEITLQQTVGVMHWGKIDQGWICLNYVDLTPVKPGESTETPEETPDKEEPTDKEDTETEDTETEKPVVIATGTVYNCYSLRIRSGAGTKNAQVGSLTAGTRVEILEKTTVNGQPWGKIDQGWICLNYVKLDETIVTPDKDTTTDPDEGTATTPDSTQGQVLATGTIYRCTSLRVREYAGTSNKHIGDLPAGTRVNIYQTTKVSGSTWGRIDQGWISLYYVQLDAAIKEPEKDPATDTEQKPGDSDTAEDQVIATGTIYRTDTLRIREKPGTKYAQVGSLTGGTRVEIYETTMIGTSKWGRIDQGWICMYYVQLDAPITEPDKDETTDKEDADQEDSKQEESTGKDTSDTSGSETMEVSLIGTIVKTDTLTVRSAPGVNNESAGKLLRGDRVEILELTTVPGGAMWGRISGGWIHMYYVQLDAENDTIKVVNTDTLRIRDGAGVKNDQVGTYTRGQMIIILETTDVAGTTWGRTDKGWVCMDYVK